MQIGGAHVLYFRVFDPTVSAQNGPTTSLQPPGTEVHPLMSTYLCFRLANMLLLKEELTVQVADINGVQVNLPKSSPSTKVQSLILKQQFYLNSMFKMGTNPSFNNSICCLAS